LGEVEGALGLAVVFVSGDIPGAVLHTTVEAIGAGQFKSFPVGEFATRNSDIQAVGNTPSAMGHGCRRTELADDDFYDVFLVMLPAYSSEP